MRNDQCVLNSVRPLSSVVERLPFKQGVVGSIPTRPTTISSLMRMRERVADERERPILARLAKRRVALGMDVGGSGIKAALVDPATGAMLSERRRVPTPKSLAPGRRPGRDRGPRGVLRAGRRAAPGSVFRQSSWTARRARASRPTRSSRGSACRLRPALRAVRRDP